MSKKILGLDLGTNSIGWALFEGNEQKQPTKLIDLGVRIFQRAVEDKTPTPKNHARRNARMARRIIQRRARRKQKMFNFLVQNGLLPKELQNHSRPEMLLNELGDPYELRAKSLDEPLTEFELGRALLHLVQRRGFQSNRKTLLGDMIDDPDMLAIFSDEEDQLDNKEESTFKKDIAVLREKIEAANCRTLGEYLYGLPKGQVKRNRKREGGDLRTDRQMYKDEFWQIIKAQISHHRNLEDIQEVLYEIIFFQRPLKFKKDRVGKCSLEPSKPRAKKAWQAFQRYRYLQDINSLRIFESYTSQWHGLAESDREKLIDLFEHDAKPTLAKIKKTLGLSRNHQLNFETATNKSFKGNLTATAIRKVYPLWDELSPNQQKALEEDLITFESKKALKTRLINHWKLDLETALNLCLIELEPEYSDLSLKAINKLLPFLEQGMIYSDARVAAGYGYEIKQVEVLDKLPAPPEIPNPIVMKGLHELKRVVNAIIKEYGKPDVIRLEMARDLEMNTKRYKAFTSQQTKNTKLNEEAQSQFENIASQNKQLGLSKYASHTDKLKYRLWQEQQNRCAYSNKQISLTELFTGAVEIDHILPYSLTLNDSYMNKVVCFASENQYKGQKTPKEAFGNDEEKWNQIEHAIANWYGRGMATKRDAFYKTSDDLDKEFIGSQLTDTRYISRAALHYLKTLGIDVNTVKGQVTSWIRHIWGMNSLIDQNKAQKDRTDHRHHAIDAAVIACIDRSFYNTVVNVAKELEKTGSEIKIKDLHIDPLFEGYRQQVATRLEEIIIVHAPERKITGALHKGSAVIFKEGMGTVYRKDVSEITTEKQIKKIVDPVVQECLKVYLALSKEQRPLWPLHRDNKTPIKRVRYIESSKIKKIDQAKAEKLPILDAMGRAFRWMSFGNTHCLLVVGNTKKPYAKQLTAYAAKQNLVKHQYLFCKDDFEGTDYVYPLFKNDLVTLDINGITSIYRVKKLGQLSQGKQPRPTLQLHTDATSSENEISDSISNLILNFKLKPIMVNSIGKIISD